MNRTRTVILRTIGICLLAVDLFACNAPIKPSVTPVPPPREGLSYPKLIIEGDTKPTNRFTHTFTFEQQNHTISIRYSDALAAAAKESEKAVAMTTEVPRSEWAAGLQWVLISDPAQDTFFETTLEKLRGIREENGLDNDRYAELLTLFVQSIPYCNAPGQPAKYPIETIADECGDCDDKSRLLAGLLHREGYETALLVFREEVHMAVGIRASGDGFMGSGFAYIETTSPSYIGFPSYEYSEVKLHSVPEIIVMGSNPKIWKKGDEVAFLYDTLNEERESAESGKSRLSKAKAENELLNAKYKQLSDALGEAKAGGDPEAYNSLVDDTNRAAERYNRAVDDYNRMVQKVNKSAEIVTYIFDHPDDRHGVYHWVKKQLDN